MPYMGVFGINHVADSCNTMLRSLLFATGHCRISNRSSARPAWLPGLDASPNPVVGTPTPGCRTGAWINHGSTIGRSVGQLLIIQDFHLVVFACFVVLGRTCNFINVWKIPSPLVRCRPVPFPSRSVHRGDVNSLTPASHGQTPQFGDENAWLFS